MRDLVAGLDAWPAYYARMAPANAAGPAAPDLSPPAEVDPAELRTRLKRGEWVVDLRHRTVFAAGHVVGTLNIGLEGSFATNLGWLLDAGTPLTLLGDTAEDVAEAQRELVRIGVERPAGQATGKPESWTTEPLGSYPTATFADLADVRHHRAVGVLDVRRRLEHDEERIEGAVNIPLHELADRVDEVPAGRGLGALRRRLPAPRSRCRCCAPWRRTPSAPWSPSTTPSTTPATPRLPILTASRDPTFGPSAR